MGEKYSELTMDELRKRLKELNAKISGRKKELIERLEAYDRNLNFGQESLQPEFSINLPDIKLYRDIHDEKQLVAADFHKINHYLEAYDKKMEYNAINLYKEKYLCYLRMGSEGNLTFVRSACRAVMRKSVSYIVDVSYCNDGHIHESQCECAAGMGPNAHCKHVCAVLYACATFLTTGILILEETCT